MDIHEFTESLIERSSNTQHIEYARFLSNHLSHVLVALCEIGASKERLEEYYKLYSAGVGHPAALEPALPLSPSFSINDKNWKDHFGTSLYGSNKTDKRPDWYGAYRTFFDAKFKQLGKQALLEEYLPHLIPGLIGAAFHPLIHIGWSLYFGSDRMLIDGLAYACFTYFRVSDNEIEPQGAAKTPLEILQQIQRDPLLNTSIHPEGFQATVTSLVENPKVFTKTVEYAKCWKLFNEMEAELSAGTLTQHKIDTVLRDMVKLVTVLYYASSCRDFFLLHAVTSVFGLEFMCSFLKMEHTRILLLKSFWLYALIVYVARGRPELVRTAPEVVNHFNWTALKNEAIKCQDEHKIKLVFVCEYFYKKYDNDSIYLKVAEEGGSFKTKWKY